MGEVVGRGNTGAKPTPTPTPKASKPALAFPGLGRGVMDQGSIDAINSRVTSIPGVEFDVTTVPDITTDDFISGLSVAQKRTLAALLRKAGFSIRTLDNVDEIIVENFSGLDTSSFSKFYKAVSNEIVPKASAGAREYRPRVDIYNVPETELESDIDEASLSAIGAILSPEEKAKFLPIQKALMAKGTRTTQRINKKGQLVTEQTPGFTREMGKEAVVEAIEKAPEYKADVERKQRIDFFKWMQER